MAHNITWHVSRNVPLGLRQPLLHACMPACCMLHMLQVACCRSLFFMRLVYLIWALLLLCTAISALGVAALAAYVAAQVRRQTAPALTVL